MAFKLKELRTALNPVYDLALTNSTLIEKEMEDENWELDESERHDLRKFLDDLEGIAALFPRELVD